MNNSQSPNPHRKLRGMLVVDIHILCQDLLVVKEPAWDKKNVQPQKIIYHQKQVHHQMYWLKKRSGTCDPFSYSVTSLMMMCFFEVSIESVIIYRCTSNFIRSTLRNCIVSIDNVATVWGFQRYNQINLNKRIFYQNIILSIKCEKLSDRKGYQLFKAKKMFMTYHKISNNIELILTQKVDAILQFRYRDIWCSDRYACDMNISVLKWIFSKNSWHWSTNRVSAPYVTRIHKSWTRNHPIFQNSLWNVKKENIDFLKLLFKSENLGKTEF